MNNSLSFDVVIIGAGPGGYVAAIRAAQLGMNTAVVERSSSLGGTCLNVGCIPSKALLESSEHYARTLHHLGTHGITVKETFLDLSTTMSRKDAIVKDLTDGIAVLMKKNKITVFHGEGTLLGSGRVSVQITDEGEKVLAAKHVVLAMGSIPVELPFLPFDGNRIVNSTDALSFSSIPRHLVVIGAGAVGLELGSVWKRLGADVTVLELLPVITPFADRLASKTLEKALRGQGLDIRLNTKVTSAEIKKRSVTLVYETSDGKAETISADKVLVSVGRKAAIEGTGLAGAGVAMEDGKIKIDENFQTSVEGVYAIGDIVRGPMLAHKASDEGIALMDRLAGKPGHIQYDLIPNVVYTNPELAQVGKTEEELKEQKIPYNSGRFFFAGNGRAKCLGEEEGMIKLLAHKETDRLLGAHIVGPRASELIHELAMVMAFEGSAEDIALTVHAHPTLSEALREAALAVSGRAIHR
ncbi:MAG TPA: dihydrolipoyl dehydrogenase [Thermoanaerobaculia bacterium]|nr:dihydrolipoyl dehydrogenase [Thermoanaerobaculia bacterium]HUM28533.1 dihydrolipoyl dehydrogenase [Thermoanaerobaculia bacterium]HXK66859.1 dihydrolipoyl dehydrogenase [Thermoanaerobaculia bacterium]